jgi:hypothetical protein
VCAKESVTMQAESIVIIVVSALVIVLVLFVLAGQFRSWRSSPVEADTTPISEDERDGEVSSEDVDEAGGSKRSKRSKKKADAVVDNYMKSCNSCEREIMKMIRTY